jgi:hypothetical protein
MDREDMWSMLHHIARSATSRSLIPLYPDRTRAELPATGSAIDCDTRWRRIYPGQRVAVAAPRRGLSSQPDFEVGTVSAISPALITLTSSLSKTYPKDSYVYPLIEVDPSEARYAIRAMTGSKGQLRLAMSETPGRSAIPALTIPGLPIAYNGHPVLRWEAAGDGDPSVGYVHELRVQSSGRGRVIDKSQARPRLMVRDARRTVSRAQWYEIAKTFDACKGMTSSFIFTVPLSPIEPVSVSGSTLVVRAVGPVQDWARIPYVSVRKVDGSNVIRKVSSVNRSSGSDSLTLSEVLGLDLSEIAFVSIAVLARFESEELVESWVTDEMAVVSFSIIELINEQSVEVFS